ncbi:MAG: MFS transporter [Chloroflexi bacterium]|nr:MFS transporter [Chloroflexota bacterium]
MPSQGSMLLKKKLNGVYYGWWVIVVSCLIYAMGTGFVFYGFSTFFDPMREEFLWSSTLTSGVFSLSRIEGGIAGPFTGWAIDKFGIRKMSFLGIILAGCGFIALVLVTENIWTLYLIFGVFLAMGYNVALMSAPSVAATKWFIRKRSLTLSIIAIAGSLGGGLLVPLMAWLIIEYGWRTTAMIAGVTILVLGLPLSLLLKNSPESEGLLPDGRAKDKVLKSVEPSVVKAVVKEEVTYTVKQALNSRVFWLYVTAMLFRSVILSGVVVHQIPYLETMGITRLLAAGLLGLMIFLEIPGKLVFGWLGDKIDKRYLLLVACLLQGVGLFVFMNANSIAMVYIFVVTFGIGYGGVIPLVIGFRADLFGRKAFASISGISVSITTIGAMTGPLLAGALYDSTGSYRIPFLIFTVMIIISGFAFLLVKHKKAPQKSMI